MLRKLLCCVTFSFVFSLFLLNSSYATTQVFHFDNVNNPAPSSIGINDLNFDPAVVFVSGSIDSSKNRWNRVFQINNGSSYGIETMLWATDGVLIDYFSVMPAGNSLGLHPWISLSTSYWGSTYDITFTFYDSVSAFKVCNCPTPDPCPEVPDNPYDDKLDALIKAVYYVPAVLLVIYFFYVMFSWYIRS